MAEAGDQPDARTPRARRWTIRLGVAAALLVAAWAAGLTWFAAGIPRPAAPSEARTDAIVVLTGGAGRLAAGLDLLAAGKGEKLFVSGVYRGVEVRELLRLARRAPEDVACCVVLGYAAGDTAGNARETAEWIASEGYRSLRLVTAAYHMPRSLLAFRRAMPDVGIVPHPVFPPGFQRDRWWRRVGSARLIVSEYHKYVAALLYLS